MPAITEAAAAVRDLEGKVALVVGGTRNMGAAIAENLARRGAQVVVSYHRHDDDAAETLARLQKYDPDARAVRSDARVPAEVQELFDGVIEHRGQLDIVVHLPGAVLKKPLADHTDDDYDRIVTDNLGSVFLTLRAAATHLADNGRCVVMSSSLTAIPLGFYGLYSASKAGVDRLVRAAAQELGGRGITVNAVTPGAIDDDFYHDAETPESVEFSKQLSVQKRLGRPDDIAPVVGFLVGVGAGWITGQIIRPNGGMV